MKRIFPGGAQRPRAAEVAALRMLPGPLSPAETPAMLAVFCAVLLSCASCASGHGFDSVTNRGPTRIRIMPTIEGGADCQLTWQFTDGGCDGEAHARWWEGEVEAHRSKPVHAACGELIGACGVPVPCDC